MKRTLKALVLLPLVVGMPMIARAQAGAPVVAVLVFENGSFGKDAKDYDGIGKGVMDLLITDLAANPKVRVVERERVQKILEEQNLTKSGAIDATTAVRVGKLFGACYSIYGSFMRGTDGSNTLTVHTTSNETGQITNPVKVSKKGDDVMGLIAEASEKFANQMDVKACPGGPVSRSGDSPAAVQQSAPTTAAPTTTPPSTSVSVSKDPAPVSSPAPTKTAAAPANKPAASSGTQLYAKQLTNTELQKLQSNKLDARTMLLYSRAIDAQDRKETAKAVSLLQQVKAKYPNFAPADERIRQLQSGD